MGPAEGNVIRILGESLPSAGRATVVSTSPHAPVNRQVLRAGEPQSPQSPTVLRITAGAPQPSLQSVVQASGTSSESKVAVLIPGGNTGTAATFVSPNGHDEPVVQTTFQPSTNGATPPYGHTPDYRTLRGRLEYSQSQRQWKLRYIPIDGQTDRFGGSVMLPDEAVQGRFQPGDFVVIEGALIDKNASSSGFAPRYQPTTIMAAGR